MRLARSSQITFGMTQPDAATTILIVDDEALFRASLCDALGAALPSYQALEAANGREALERFEETSVDVVVTDINMPVMNGLELLLALRDRSFRGPILVVTAFGDPRLESEVELRGAFCYHEKPIDLPVLIESIRAAAEGEYSHIEGLTLAGFVQLLELERKTCRLRVQQDGRQGDLLFRDGILLDAKMDRLSGDEAALEILGWEEGAELDLHAGVKPQRKTISSRLSHLLLEAMQRQDEKRAQLTEGDDGVPVNHEEKETNMGNVEQSLHRSMEIDGAIGVALVDHESGMSLGHLGGGKALNLEVACAGNTEVVRAKMKVMRDIGLDDKIEDILITLSGQYHLIRPLVNAPNLFLYLALIRSKSNLAMARHKLTAIEKDLVL